jgi:spermidine synthase
VKSTAGPAFANKSLMKSVKHNLVAAVVFVTGASILSIEVVGVRVLSPYYGNTIFTVSSVISVILLALSSGYYAGGRFADRHPSLQWFFGIILVSGLVLLVFYGLGVIILPFLSSKLSISVGPLVSAVLLFLLPALLLGTLSPYAVKLQSVYFPEQGVGSVAGNIFFWSTLGSIIGSLLAGFVLIPHFGIDRILIANGVLLFVLGLVPLLVLGLRRKAFYGSLLAFALVLGGAWFANHYERRNALYSRDGIYQKITIYDDSFSGRPVRFLQQDQNSEGAGEGAMFLDSDDPRDLVYGYTRYYSLYKIFTPRVENALMIGGGAYSVPKALLRDLPSARIDVVEIEPSLFPLAKQYFRVTEAAQLHHYVEDGRRFLQDSDRKYDLMFSDVYYSFFSVPPHFTTKEFFAVAKSKLSDGGIFIANMIGDLSRQQPSLIMAEIKTFQTVFPNSYFFAVESPDLTSSQNVMLVGYKSDHKLDFDSPSIAAYPDPLIRLLPYKRIDVSHRFDLSPYPVLTDNYSPVEYLTARVLERAFGEPKAIDGKEMLAVADQDARYGPRTLGAPGHDQMRDFLLAEMKVLAEDVKAQSWSSAGSDGKTYERTNIIGRFYSSEERRVILAARYDSGSPDLREAPGVALLVELARSLGSSPVAPSVGLDLVFLDGAGNEDPSGKDGHSQPLGAAYFARHLDEIYGSSKPVSAIVLDGVCAKDLRILKEQSSVKNAPAQVEALWGIGRRINSRIFQDRIGQEVANDQTALNQAGIPSILLTGWDDRGARVVGDVPGGCSPGSMESVAQALSEYLRLPN